MKISKIALILTALVTLSTPALAGKSTDADRKRAIGRTYPIFIDGKGTQYKEAEVVALSAGIVKIQHSGGVTKVSLADLPSYRQRELHYDKELAAVELAAQKKKSAKLTAERTATAEAKKKKAAIVASRKVVKNPATKVTRKPTKRADNHAVPANKHHPNYLQIASLSKSIRSKEAEINKLDKLIHQSLTRNSEGRARSYEKRAERLNAQLVKARDRLADLINQS